MKRNNGAYLDGLFEMANLFWTYLLEGKTKTPELYTHEEVKNAMNKAHHKAIRDVNSDITVKKLVRVESPDDDDPGPQAA